MNRKEIRKQNIIQFILLILIISLINYISSFVFFRLDLTADKRYTISKPTKKYISELDDVVYFQIYLEGDLPYGFKKLQRSVKEMLQEFRVYGGTNIEYEFIDPAESQDNRTREEIFNQLYEKGLQPTNLQVKEKDGSQSQKIIFPGMILNYRGREFVLNILQNNPLYSSEVNLNNSIQGLEYEIINGIKNLSNPLKQDVAFLQGHGELDENYSADIFESLKEFYEIQRLTIDGQLDALKGIELLIVAKPDSAFDEKDKFIIDQFIMKGGKVFWLLDFVQADMDSLAYTSSTMALINRTNLEDQLFKYGVRINYTIIQDMQCAVIPVNTAFAGATPKFAPAPWIYFPLVSPLNNHAINKNLNLVKADFASVIDTVGQNPEIRKTYLMTSSKYARTVRAPLRISLDIINERLDARQFPLANLPMGVLLEGQFESVFKNRITSTIAESDEIDYQEKSVETKMIVIADGDIIKNQIRRSGDKVYPFPLGYDRYTQQTYGNKEFVLNCINYLLDDSGIMSIRNRELTLRLTDKQKINNERIFWQTLNLLVPLLFIILVGFLWYYIRRKRFTN